MLFEQGMIVEDTATGRKGVVIVEDPTTLMYYVEFPDGEGYSTSEWVFEGELDFGY